MSDGDVPRYKNRQRWRRGRTEARLTVSADQVAWAAGYLEGEAWFGLNSGLLPAIRVASRDSAPLERLLDLFGGKLSSRPVKSGKYAGTIYWNWGVYADQAVLLARAVTPWLSPRRLDQVQKLLKYADRYTLVDGNG